MKRNLNEHIERIKKLSLITEDVPQKNVNQNSTNQNNDIQLAKTIDSPQFNNEFQKNINNMMSKIQNDVVNMGKSVGDKDGQLEIQGESYRVSESVVGLGVGAALAAPKIIDLVSKGISRLGIRLNNNTLQKLGAKGVKLGHNIHEKYHRFVKNILKKLPQYTRLPEEKQNIIVDGIMLGIITTALLTSLGGAATAYKAGQAGIGAAETALSAVKGIEVGELMPVIFATLFK